MLVFGDGGGFSPVRFPTSFGRFYQNRNFGFVQACSPYINSGKVTNMSGPWKLNHMGIIPGTGEWENTRHESLRLASILRASSTSWMTVVGAVTTGTTGATCYRSILGCFRRPSWRNKL